MVPQVVKIYAGWAFSKVQLWILVVRGGCLLRVMIAGCAWNASNEEQWLGRILDYFSKESAKVNLPDLLMHAMNSSIDSNHSI